MLDSREKALRAIMAGDVLVDGQRADKAGALVSTEAEVELKGRSPYVSRGGEKLAHALETACCSAAPASSTRWMSAAASSTTSCARMRVWS